MRHIGTSAYGVRLPIIGQGDMLPEIVADSVAAALNEGGMTLTDNDIIGITEAVVAKAQGNFASIHALAADVRQKYPAGTVGVVFPILSRNRFLNILKGISAGADKVYVLLACPSDEVGNPIMNLDEIDRFDHAFDNGPLTGDAFRKLSGNYLHPFTGMDYISLYEQAGDNIEVYVSSDPRHILRLTSHVLAADIHTRMRTARRLKAAGAKTVYTLSDLLSSPVDGSGYNPDYGVLGSNLSTGDVLKLFPRDCGSFVEKTRAALKTRTGASPEVLVYGDGAFKDPAHGIWELADPVVSPSHTSRLAGQPNEIKLKYVADNVFKALSGEERTRAVEQMIREHDPSKDVFREGTTPRKYADLLGSLCDLMSGSGDKGTPVILIRGYFDNYASK